MRWVSSIASSARARNITARSSLRKKIVSKSAYVQKIGKEAFYRQREMTLADAYRYGAEVMAENMMARDAEEGIGAFIEKRAPKWENTVDTTAQPLAMNHDQYDDSYIREILNGVKTIAVVGASANESRPSLFVVKNSAERDYKFFRQSGSRRKSDRRAEGLRETRRRAA